MHFFIFTEELINSFHATCLFLYPLKTSENLWFSDVFRGYRKIIVAIKGLMENWFFVQLWKFEK